MRSGKPLAWLHAAAALGLGTRTLDLAMLGMPITRRGGYYPAESRYVRNARLNRSNRWKFARTYKEARELSPFPERPVR